MVVDCTISHLAEAHDVGSTDMNSLNRAVRLLGAGGGRHLRQNAMVYLSKSNGLHPAACYASNSQAASDSPAAAATSSESWDGVLDILSSLIKHKTRADGKNWRDAHENMPVYLKVGFHCSSWQQHHPQQQHYIPLARELVQSAHIFKQNCVTCSQRLGIEESVQKLNVIHVAGTKGKVGPLQHLSTNLLLYSRNWDVDIIHICGKRSGFSPNVYVLWQCKMAFVAAALRQVAASDSVNRVNMVN
jgi:hypothetical protein